MLSPASGSAESSLGDNEKIIHYNGCDGWNGVLGYIEGKSLEGRMKQVIGGETTEQEVSVRLA